MAGTRTARPGHTAMDAGASGLKATPSISTDAIRRLVSRTVAHLFRRARV